MGCHGSVHTFDFNHGSATAMADARDYERHFLCAARWHCVAAVVIGSQSVKTTESGGISGYDAGKKIKGRKRHISADGGYARDKLKKALSKIGDWTLGIVRRSDKAKSF